MESWSLGYDGDRDVEHHAGIEGSGPRPSVRLRVVSDYI